MTSSEILLKAADLIENDGLAKGAYRKDGAFCVIGACRFAAYQSVIMHGNEMWKIDKYFDRISGTNKSISLWNDAPERTKEEVVAKLREAATWTDDDLHM